MVRVYRLWLSAHTMLWYWLHWRHNGHDSVPNHQPHDCLLNRLFGRRSKTTPKLRVSGLCAGNSPGTSEFPAQMASNAENVSIWWRHHDYRSLMAVRQIPRLKGGLCSEQAESTEWHRSLEKHLARLRDYTIPCVDLQHLMLFCEKKSVLLKNSTCRRWVVVYCSSSGYRSGVGPHHMVLRAIVKSYRTTR